jgi:hypothetical protein
MAELPPYAALMTHPVEDVDRWKAVFDADEPNRIAAGFLGHHINRAEDDPNLITLFLALSDRDKAKAFSEDPKLGEAMKQGGVLAPPEIRWLQPIRESIVWDRQLPALMMHPDMDALLAALQTAKWGELMVADGVVPESVVLLVEK